MCLVSIVALFKFHLLSSCITATIPESESFPLVKNRSKNHLTDRGKWPDDPLYRFRWWTTYQSAKWKQLILWVFLDLLCLGQESNRVVIHLNEFKHVHLQLSETFTWQLDSLKTKRTLNLDILKLFDPSFYHHFKLFLVLWQLHCKFQVPLFYLAVVLPHQLYSCILF